MRPWLGCALALLGTATVAPPARAAPPGLDADPAVALTISGVAIAATIVAALAIPVPEHDLDEAEVGELFGFDEPMRGRWLLSAHALSNATLVSALALPLVAHASVTGPDQADALLVYAEAMSTTILVNTVTKRLVARRRPYTFGEGGRERRSAEGADAYLSFYSGHAATSFAAATTGALSMSLRSDDQEARALVWSLGLATAAATGVFRVRAGRHFPSDVLVGAIAGTAAGIVFPLLHAQGDPHVSGEDLGAAAGGLLGGALLALVWPLDLPAPPPLTLAPADADGGLVASVGGAW